MLDRSDGINKPIPRVGQKPGRRAGTTRAEDQLEDRQERLMQIA
jgi:hypothetical protein